VAAAPAIPPTSPSIGDSTPRPSDGSPQIGGAASAERRPSFTDFYKSNFASLVVLASAVAHDNTFAEDIVQETMSLVHDRWRDLETRGTARAWARRTVVNKSIDRRRRLTRERGAMPRLWEDRPNPIAPSENHSLWEAVRQLPTKQRVAVVLFYVDGYSTDEIASVLECSGSSARTSLHRARVALAQTLGSRSEYEGNER
jgi:RNA polymerase sigma-70 factor (ECF subfamily)